MKITNTLPGSSLTQLPDERYARVLEALYEVIDPEIGVNIIDLGLVYSLDIEGTKASIEMTMTTPACPLSAYLKTEVEQAVLRAVPELSSVGINLTFDPPWNPNMMSNAAKHELGWYP